MTTIGYARVSTAEQDPGLQIAALKAAGVRRIVHEHRSGAGERPELEKLLQGLQPGQVLMVYKVDRLARSLVDLLRVLAAVADAGASFKSLTEPIETTSAAGRMLVQLLGAFAEFERAIIRERCAAGRAVARERGVQFGRPPLTTRAMVLDAIRDGRSLVDAARFYGVSESAMGRRAKVEGLRFQVDGRRQRYARLSGPVSG